MYQMEYIFKHFLFHVKTEIFNLKTTRTDTNLVVGYQLMSGNRIILVY